jgi:hypothetical protein
VKKKMYMALHTTDEHPDSVEKSLAAQMGLIVQTVSELKVLLANSCVYVPVGPITDCCLTGNYEDGIWCAPVYADGEVWSTTLVGNSGAKDTEKGCIVDGGVDVCSGGRGPVLSEPLISLLFSAVVSPVVEKMVPPGHSKANVCSGCWEELPVPCFCGAAGMCSHCAEVLSTIVSPGSGFPDVVSEGAVGMRDLMAALQENARNLANQFDQVDGMFQSNARDVAEMRRDMVSVADFQRLVRRIRELEGEAVEESSDSEDFVEQTGYTDSEGDGEMSDWSGNEFEE